jgi:hypothetical protein
MLLNNMSVYGGSTIMFDSNGMPEQVSELYRGPAIAGA